MAVLTTSDLQDLRQGAETEGVWSITKAQLNSVFQALEDEYQTNTKGAWSTAIDAAVAGLTTTQKKSIGRWWMRKRFDLDAPA